MCYFVIVQMFIFCCLIFFLSPIWGRIEVEDKFCANEMRMKKIEQSDI